MAFKTIAHYARASRSAKKRNAPGRNGSRFPGVPRKQRCAIRVTYSRNTVRGQWRAHGRYIARESALFDEIFGRADELNEDPLHGFLVGLKMFAEMMADLPTGHPGCLIASYCYQDRLFDKEVRELNAAAVLNWRKRFRQRLDLIAERYPPRVEIDLDDLADMLSVIADGGIILSKAIKDKQVLARQMLLYRDFIKAVFLGVPSS